jgi:hypothetical protein
MELKLSLLLLIIFSLNAVDATAQGKKKKKKRNSKDQVQAVKQSNSFRPYIPEEKQVPKNKNSKKNDKGFFATLFFKQLDDKVDQFYQRLEDNAKRKRKIERKMKHPQYSDFSYFGHKRKPKIRPVGKRKFCKECGIVH